LDWVTSMFRLTSPHEPVLPSQKVVEPLTFHYRSGTPVT